ncbi:MAG: hypothetical protein ABF308_24540, partial [Phaeobacter gallaeciensis]
TQKKKVLTISDIGISKGIGKNMTAVIGLTNLVSKSERQWLCVCKSRKGEGRNIPVLRDFEYQRFVASPEEVTNDSDEGDRATKPDKRAKFADEISRLPQSSEALSFGKLKANIVEVTGIAPSTAAGRIRDYQTYGLIKKDPNGKYEIIPSQKTA